MIHKYIISLALMASVLSACSKPQHPEPVRVENDIAITFVPAVGTKGYITDAMDQAFTTKGFGVFAGKTEIGNPASKKEIMSNVAVHYDDIQHGWTYTAGENDDPYWSINCRHDFLAIYPYSNSITKYTFTAEEICHISMVETIRTVNNRRVHDCDDYMYARAQKEYHLGEIPSPVDLQMRHALSAICFQVRNASDYDVVGIKDISFSGLYTVGKDLQISRAEGNEPVFGYPLETIESYDYDPVTGTTDAPFLPIGSPDFKDLVGNKIILPQSFLNQNVVLSMTVTFYDRNEQKTFDQPLKKIISVIPLQGNGGDRYSYFPGKRYLYKIDILNNFINCNVNVIDWIDDKDIELN